MSKFEFSIMNFLYKKNKTHANKAAIKSKIKYFKTCNFLFIVFYFFANKFSSQNNIILDFTLTHFLINYYIINYNLNNFILSNLKIVESD